MGHVQRHIGDNGQGCGQGTGVAHRGVWSGQRGQEFGNMGGGSECPLSPVVRFIEPIIEPLMLYNW